MFDWLSPRVELSSDVAAAEWIVTSLDPWGADRLHVSNLLPGGFESYARVFHPVEHWDGSETTIRSWTEIGAECGVLLSPDVSFADVVGFEGDDWGKLMSFGPDPGRLPTRACQALSTVLGPRTESPDECWFGLWEGSGFLLPGGLFRSAGSTLKERRQVRREIRREAKDNAAARKRLASIPTVRVGHGRDFLLFRGPVMAACSFEPMKGYFLSPSLWWPNDRAWVVATEIDGLSTYVGGSRGAIGAITAAPDLEAIEITREALID